MAMAAAAAKKEVKIQTAFLEVPMLETNAYATRRIDVTLNDDQARRLRSLVDGLSATNARLKNGRHVETGAQAVFYLLENLEEKKNNTDDAK